MLVVSVPLILFIVLSMVGGAVFVASSDGTATLDGVKFLFGIFALVILVMVASGGVSMITRKNHGMALTAAIILCLGCLFPLGVWAVIVLNNNDYKRQFR